MEYIKLVGILIVILGFALKLDSILIIVTAAAATAGYSDNEFIHKYVHSFPGSANFCRFRPTPTSAPAFWRKRHKTRRLKDLSFNLSPHV